MQYTLKTNKLTQPTSYYAMPMPEIVGEDTIIEEIAVRSNLSRPTVSAVITELRNAISRNLRNGKAITLENFVRFSITLPGRIDNFTESANKENLEVSAVIANDIRDNVRFDIPLEKVASVEKVPTISFTTYEYNEAVGLVELRGNNLEFDKEVTDEGVFYYNTVGKTELRAEQYGSITNTKNILSTPSFPYNALGWNEYKIRVKARYTPGGTIRTGEYATPVRSIREISTSDAGSTVTAGNIMVSKYDTSQYGMITGATYTAPGGAYAFRICLSPAKGGVPELGDVTKIWVETKDGVGPVVDVILAEGVQDVPLTCNVAALEGNESLTEFTIRFTNMVGLATLTNRYYGGVIYESVLITDNVS